MDTVERQHLNARLHALLVDADAEAVRTASGWKVRVAYNDGYVEAEPPDRIGQIEVALRPLLDKLLGEAGTVTLTRYPSGHNLVRVGFLGLYGWRKETITELLVRFVLGERTRIED